jgi:putative heme-binding domain-containing protein
METLGRFNRPEVARELVKRWVSLTPRLRSEAVILLLARPERAAILLDSIEAGTIHRTDLSSTQAGFLRAHRDPTLRLRASKILGSSTSSEREEVVKAFAKAVELPASAARGKPIYLERCSACHRLGQDGHAVGPDLASVKTSGKEKILLNILDPNREVQPAYLVYLVETRDEESLIGLVANENAVSLTVRQAYNKETIVPRSNIKTLRNLGQSLMPEGIETGLDLQAMADLLEYITTAEASSGR